ncbi:MAG: hypothetical protein MRQ09_02560 [Candidatus Midichloria sp.]|nr:hypothetical protein [Candidatus Midichloria sp.]
MFIPLGGTSNHFRANVLKQLKWDQFNLTEDADMGVRLKKVVIKLKLYYGRNSYYHKKLD